MRGDFKILGCVWLLFCFKRFLSMSVLCMYFIPYLQLLIYDVFLSTPTLKTASMACGKKRQCLTQDGRIGYHAQTVGGVKEPYFLPTSVRTYELAGSSGLHHPFHTYIPLNAAH